MISDDALSAQSQPPMIYFIKQPYTGRSQYALTNSSGSQRPTYFILQRNRQYLGVVARSISLCTTKLEQTSVSLYGMTIGGFLLNFSSTGVEILNV